LTGLEYYTPRFPSVWVSKVGGDIWFLDRNVFKTNVYAIRRKWFGCQAHRGIFDNKLLTKRDRVFDLFVVQSSMFISREERGT